VPARSHRARERSILLFIHRFIVVNLPYLVLSMSVGADLLAQPYREPTTFMAACMPLSGRPPLLVTFRLFLSSNAQKLRKKGQFLLENLDNFKSPMIKSIRSTNLTYDIVAKRFEMEEKSCDSLPNQVPESIKSLC